MESWNPELPIAMQESLHREKEQAFTLYLDFIVDGTASMYTVFPAIYFAVVHILDCLSRYEVTPKLGLTILRNEMQDERTEVISFDDREKFTQDTTLFLKKLKAMELYGGGNDGRESVHKAINVSLHKFPAAGRNKAIFVFSDAYESNDEADYSKIPIGQAVFFTTDELSQEDFHFAFIQPDGEIDEEASPMFLPIQKLLKPMSSSLLDNVVKPLKDLMKGISVGA